MKNNIEKTIENLEKYNNSQYPILSVYLGFGDKKSAPSSALSSQFHSLIHQNLGEQEKKLFRKDLEKIDDFIKTGYDSRGKRSVVFFSAGKKLWEMLDFEFYLEPLCLVSYSPYLHPITQALRKYRKYLVLLADREKARMFTVHLGKIREHKDVINGVVPQKVKAIKTEWGRYDKIERHIDDHLHRHLQLITKATHEFAKNNPVSFIIIGGHEEMIPKIKKNLKYPLNKLIIGEFVSELNISINEIFLRSKKIAGEVSR